MFEEDICGYHQTLFPQRPPHTCILCFNIPKSPRICKGCSSLYCQEALEKIANQCFTCAQKTFLPLEGQPLRDYLNLIMFCPMCSKNMTIEAYEQHGCLHPKVPCENSEVCNTDNIGESILKAERVCSPACLLIMAKKKGKNQKQIYEMIARLAKDKSISYFPQAI